jgi:predicted exporter
MRPLASSKSVAFAIVEAILILRRRTRNAIAFVEPFQQIAILASLAAKRCKGLLFRLFAQRALVTLG